MDATVFVPVLALITFALVIAFALKSKASVEARRDSDAPKSTLAKDAPDQR